MSLSDDLINNISEKINQKISNIDQFKNEIVISDAEKEPWDQAISLLDSELLKEINKANSAIYAVRDAYQDRIDSGCYSDLFWKVDSISIGPAPTYVTFYTLVVDQLSISGYGNTISFVGSSGGTIDYTRTSKFGFQSDNLHALVYKDQPYLKDIGDTTILSFIGSIGVGSTILTIISPTNNSVISGSISTGSFIISSKAGIFPGGNATVVGFGSTVFYSEELESVVGVATTSIATSYIILDQSSSSSASFPELDGSYVTFTNVTNPDQFQELESGFDYGINFTEDPFSPETIGIVNVNNVGIGRLIKYDNSGNPTNTQSWDPNYEGIEVDGEKVKEPIVGSGKVYYKIGFNRYPIDLSGDPASKGDTIVVTSLSGRYANTPSCSSSIASKLANAISSRDSIESNLQSNFSEFNTILDTSNYLRQERDQYALRIWSLRQSIGGEGDDIDRYKQVKEYLGFSTITGVL